MTLQTIETPVGTLNAVWTAQGKLYACEFADAGHASAASEQAGECTFSNEIQTDGLATNSLSFTQRLLADRLNKYFSTGRLQWDLGILDWRGTTPFHRQVLECCAQIPVGETLTYGELAARTGRPLAARAVGSAMARNRWPLIIPCHRVVGSNGRLTGYSGTGGIETKRHLLGLEAGELLLALT